METSNQDNINGGSPVDDPSNWRSDTDVDPAIAIANMEIPDWDTFFMAMVFVYAMRSPDRQTKQGCVIVDNASHVPIGFGFNGHPRKCGGLPTDRPEKYPFMVHADINAILNMMHQSPDATMYLPMPPCEVCFGAALNLPFTKITRIVYYEDRDFPHTRRLSGLRPDVKLCRYDGGKPDRVRQLMLQAARYVQFRDEHSGVLSAGSTPTYR